MLLGIGTAAVLACGGCVGLTLIGAANVDRPSSPITTAAPPAGEAAPPTAKPSPTTIVVKLGETLILTRTGLGTSVEFHYTLTAGGQFAKSPKYGSKPEKGIFFAVNATIEVKKGSTYAYSGDFALVAQGGTVYEPSGGFGFDGALEGVSLNAGQRAAGLVVFDVPQAALVGARIELRADLFSNGDDGYWQL